VLLVVYHAWMEKIGFCSISRQNMGASKNKKSSLQSYRITYPTCAFNISRSNKLIYACWLDIRVKM